MNADDTGTAAAAAAAAAGLAVHSALQPTQAIEYARLPVAASGGVL
jgi:hypothetical protein